MTFSTKKVFASIDAARYTDLMTSTKRKKRATQLETILSLIDDLGRRVAVYDGDEVASLRAALGTCRLAFQAGTPARKPTLKQAQTRDLTAGSKVIMTPNSDYDDLVNPLTVKEDAVTGRPTRVLVTDAKGVSTLIEASLLLVERAVRVPAKPATGDENP